MYELLWQYPSQSTIDPIALTQAENIFPEEFWIQRPEWHHHLRPVDEGTTWVIDPVNLSSQEFVGPEEFWRQTSEPVREIPRPVDEGLFVFDPETRNNQEFVGPEEFREPNPEWIAAVPRPVDEGIFVIDLHTIGDSEFISIEEFWVQRPEWFHHLRPVDVGLFVSDTETPVPPAEPDVEHWFVQRPEWLQHLRPVDEGLFAIDANAFSQQPDVNPPSPTWSVIYRIQMQYPSLATMDPVTPVTEEVDSEHWWRQPSEPVFEIKTPEGIFVIDLQTIGDQEFVGPEEFKIEAPDWIQHLRLADEGLFVIGEETADTGESIEKWWRITDPIFDIKTPEGLWVIDPITFGNAEFAALEWWLQRPEFIDDVKRPVDEGLWAIDRQGLGDAEFAALEWFLQRPEWLQHLRPTDTGLWVADTVMEEISAELDWWKPVQEPVRELLRPVDEGLFLIDSSTIGDAEFDRLQWFLQRPEWFLHLRPTDTGLWVGDVNPVFVPSEDTSWWRQTSEPVRELFRLIDEGLFVTDLFRQGDAEFAALEWLVQRPEFIDRLRFIEPGLFIIDQRTEPDIEQWFRQASEPVREQLRPVDEGIWVIDLTNFGTGESVLPDKFWIQNPEWIARLLPTNEGIYVAQFHIDAAPAEPDLEHWWRQTSEPIREISRPVDTGLFVIDPNILNQPEFISLEEFWVQRPEYLPWPVPAQLRQGIFVIDPITLGIPGVIIVVVPKAILEGCVDLEDLINRLTWIDNVDPSSFIDPVEIIIPSGYIKPSSGKNLWDL